jgi:hypothetical protein
MLDVHPPHEAAHTWKDFLIHIATIVVGLIIAVGLEQTVELVHHSHQRHELQENLRIDNELNRDWANQDLDAARRIREWAQDQASLLDHANPSALLTLRTIPTAQFSSPNFGVYLAAQANGQISLLSNWQQNWQADGNRKAQQIFVSDTGFLRGLHNALGDLNQSLIGHALPSATGVLDISALSAAQRARLVEQLLAITEAARRLENALITYASFNEFILTNPEQTPGEGATQTEEKFSKIEHRFGELYPGTDYIFTTR